MQPRGFTLVEMLVSVAIFAIVMTIALGALLAMSESDRKAQTLKSVVNNLNFSLDAMSRSIRTGASYHCDVPQGTITAPRDCPNPPSGASPTAASSFAFLSAGAGQGTVAYCRGNGSTCSASGTAILRSVSGGAYTAITSPEVVITSLLFYVIGAEAIGVQPKVTILISGRVQNSAVQQSVFNLQTTVTQRLYDQ